jgi:orotidine-5'-phosphate decarboxylase
MLNVHAQGGRDMLLASRDAIDNEINKLGCKPPLLLGVTVLTSMDKSDLLETGVDGSVLEQVKRLTVLCAESGLDGVVCSANEIETVREIAGPNFKIITPGIRPAWSEPGDQKRIVTPGDAIKRGGDFLVIGRPITQSKDPADSIRKIIIEIEGELR